MNVVRRGLLAGVTAALLAATLPAALVLPQRASAAPTAESDTRTVGTWRIRADATGGYVVTWRSPRALPVTDARPEFYAGDALLGAPATEADGHTLTLTLPHGVRPDPADLSVVLSGRVLDSAEPAVATSGTARRFTSPAVRAARAHRAVSTDPGVRGRFDVVTSNYRLSAQPIAGMPEPSEMLGHVVRPAARTARPLVLFLHGRHQPCFRSPDATGRGRGPWPCPRGTRPVPSHLGYDYAQRLLASQGYVTVSVSANAVNAQDFLLADGGAAARAALVRHHLAQWARWAKQGRFAVDMNRVVLVGHSRGGEGVDQATLETPLSAPYRIVGQVLLAPTNFGRRAAAYVPTVAVLPYCDGDVVDLQGQSYTDIARDLAADDTSLHSSVLLMGANHNFFNTEWTPRISAAPSSDDGAFLPGRLCRRDSPTRLSAAQQRAAARAYIAGAVAMTAGRDATMAEMFDGRRVRVPSAGPADVRVHAVGGGRDVRRAGRDASPRRSDTASVTVCTGRAGSSRAGTCGRGLSEIRTPHWVFDSAFTRGVPTASALQMQWSNRGRTASLALDRPMDLSTAAGLDLRTAVDPRLGPVRLRVRAYDGQGRVAELTPRRGRLLQPLPGADQDVLGKIWAQPVRLPVRATSAIDATDVRRIELVSASVRGRVWVFDVAATPPRPAAVPLRRLPRVSLGTLRVREGDGADGRVARVPFRIEGTVRSTARLVVLAQDLTDGTMLAPRKVTIRPGRTRGSVPVAFSPDTLDDLRVQQTLLTAVPVRGAMTRHYLGRMRLLDDDPSPRVRIRAVAAEVTEGGQARWQVTLSREVDYDTFVVGNVVAGRTTLPHVSAGDVPSSWLSDHFLEVPPPDRPLHQGRPVVFSAIRPGRTRAVLTVPLRRDSAVEGSEALTLRVRTVPRLVDPVRRTVTVLD
jgi:hypothetical protein